MNGVLLRLAVGSGRAAAGRLALVVLAATLGAALLLLGAGVATLSGSELSASLTAYLLEPELRRGVVIGVVLCAVPLVLLLAAASRVATRQREQRLAGLRLAGADSRQVRGLAALDTAVGTAAGAVLGAGLFLVARELVVGAAPTSSQTAQVASAVLPPLPVAVLVLLVFVAGSAALSALSLRALLITPLGVVRRAPRRRPRPYGLVLLLVGVGGFAVVARLTADSGSGVQDLLLGLCLLALMVGLVTAGPWTASLVGRLLARTARGPAALLAGRRLEDDPRGQSRASTAVVLVVLAAGFAVVTGQEALAADGLGGRDDFYLQGYRAAALGMAFSLAVGAAGLVVATLEGIVERRRTLAALHAGGVGRGVLGRATLLQVVLPVLPQAVLALVAAVLVVGRLSGGSAVPWGGLALVLLAAVGVVLLATAATLPALRRGTSVEALRTP